MMEISDSELLMLTLEKNEDAEEILNNRYKEVINFYINKYKNILIKLNINIQDLFNACFLVYQLAISNYTNTSSASFKTYTSLLIERKIKKTIIKQVNNNNKMRLINFSEIELIDNKLNDYTDSKDPLDIICNNEESDFLKNILSKYFEYKDIYILQMYSEGISLKYISTIFDIPYTNLVKKIKRMKIKISREYKKMFE